MPGSSGVYLGMCFSYRLLNIAKLKVPYHSSEFQTVCCVLLASTSLVALTSCNTEAVEKTQLCYHNSTFIFIFRRKYLLKLPFDSQKVKTFLIGMVSMSTRLSLFR